MEHLIKILFKHFIYFYDVFINSTIKNKYDSKKYLIMHKLND